MMLSTHLRLHLHIDWQPSSSFLCRYRYPPFRHAFIVDKTTLRTIRVAQLVLINVIEIHLLHCRPPHRRDCHPH